MSFVVYENLLPMNLFKSHFFIQTVKIWFVIKLKHLLFSKVVYRGENNLVNQSQNQQGYKILLNLVNPTITRHFLHACFSHPIIYLLKLLFT